MLFSIGHSNHNLERFVELLLQHHIEVVVDVRSRPQSRFSPHFNKSVLQKSLEQYTIKYHHCVWLWGGHQDTELYRKHFNQEIAYVVEAQKTQRVCLMCSEGEPRITKNREYECHRLSLLSPAFCSQGVAVSHILPNGEIFEPTRYENKKLF